MEIKIKDFDIVPLICPANLKTPNCAPCNYANFYKVFNPPVSGAFVSFGSVRCNYIETVTKQIEDSNKGP